MKLVCLMPARNEAWVLGLSARAVLQWCDWLLILDHASTDETRPIVSDVMADIPRVTYLHEGDPQWNEMAHRQRMLDMARDQGATHIISVDADEVLTGNLLPRIRNLVECTTPTPGLVLQLPWLAMRGSIERYEAWGPWARENVSVAFADDPRLHWAARQGYDFHHRHPMGLPFQGYKPLHRDEGGLMHLQFVSDRRLRAKQALYKMTEVTRWPWREPVAAIDALYSRAVYGQKEMPSGLVQYFGIEQAREIQREARRLNPSIVTDGPEKLARVPPTWWEPYAEWMQYLDVDAEPWQEAECRKLWAEHGPTKFQGLDLFGVCG